MELDDRIIRIVELRDLELLIGTASHIDNIETVNGTFRMANLLHYSRTEGLRRDPKEAIVRSENNASRNSEMLYSLISCWTVYSTPKDLLHAINSEFCQKNKVGICIVSTIEKVKSVMNAPLKKLGYEYQRDIKIDYSKQPEQMIPGLHKEKKFEMENEIRFIYKSCRSIIDSIIFYVDPRQYIDEIIIFNSTLDEYHNTASKLGRVLKKVRLSKLCPCGKIEYFN